MPSGLAYLFEHVLLCHVDGDFLGGAHVSKVNGQVTYPLSVKTSVHLWMWLKMKRVGYTGGKANSRSKSTICGLSTQKTLKRLH